MTPRSLSHPLSSVCFESKIHFSARRDLSSARSKCFKAIVEAESRGDVWGIKPPDFSLKVYRCVSDPQARDGKARSDPSAPRPHETRGNARSRLQHVPHGGNNRKDPSDSVVSCWSPGALESELTFVRSGKNPPGPYKNPRPHNFRPLDETLPDIVTAYEKDPGNMKLKSKHLDTHKSRFPPVPTTVGDSDSSVKETKARMDVRKPAEPQWDARLVLPRLPWPPQSASYTRHRRRRGAYGAFLDRVEEKLSRSWRKA